MKRWSCLLVFVPLLFAVTVVPLSAEEVIRYHGSSTLLTSVMKPLTKRFSATKDVTFNMVGKNTGAGIKALTAGACDVAGAGRKPKTMEYDKAGGDLKAHLVAHEGIAILVNKANPVDSFTTQQLKDIFSGKISSWDKAGWAGGGDIVVVVSAVDSTNYELFEKKIMKGIPFAGGAINVKINPLVPSQIEKYPVAIGFGTPALAQGNEKVKEVALDGVRPDQETVAGGAYPITKKYYLVTKGAPGETVKEFIDFCQGQEGQEIIEKAGYFRSK